LGSCDSVEGYLPSVHDDFVLLAVSAAFYIIGYPSTHSDPVVCLACFPNGFISSRVSGCRMVVYKGHQLSFSRFGRCCDDSLDKQLWFQECLILIVILALVGVGWSG